MDVLSGADDVEAWITDRSARATFEFEEDKTRRFEWFLSADKAKATLIEVFDDGEGALTRLQNLMSSQIAAEWMDRFEIESLTVLGEVSEDLQDALTSMAPDKDFRWRLYQGLVPSDDYRTEKLGGVSRVDWIA